MKIVHVYAQNIQVFVDAVKDTDCRLNASRDLNYLLSSLSNYNAKDVLGLIIFANPMTKKCLKLLEKFDRLFVYQQMPVVIISDRVQDLYKEGYLKVKHSKLYLVTSEENTISDIDVSAIFTTLLASADEIYDLSGCSMEKSKRQLIASGFEEDDKMSESLLSLLEIIQGRELDEYRPGG